jgi:hypothetical protein
MGRGAARGARWGGTGGASVCVAYQGTAPTTTSNTCTNGSGGTGGSNGTSNAPSGPTGVTADVRDGWPTGYSFQAVSSSMESWSIRSTQPNVSSS